MASRNKGSIFSETSATVKAAQLGSQVGSSVKGRDSLTRVKSPIKGIPTQGRQWNRYSP